MITNKLLAFKNVSFELCSRENQRHQQKMNTVRSDYHADAMKND